VAPFSSNLIWQWEQPSRNNWHIWSQALHLAFGPQLIIAIPLGGWLHHPHQPTVHIPYDPALDLLYQPGHHGVWWVLTKLCNALVTNSFTHYTYTRAAPTVPSAAYHIAFASPGPAQTVHFQGSSPQPLHLLLPCLLTYFTYGRTGPGLCTRQSSQTMARQQLKQSILAWHMGSAMART